MILQSHINRFRNPIRHGMQRALIWLNEPVSFQLMPQRLAE
jgi:hypothetical protein